MDVSEVTRPMAAMPGLLSSMYPRLYAPACKGRFVYRVYWQSGNGSWSCCLTTPDREQAQRLFGNFRKTPAYWEMRDSFTETLLGEEGRNVEQLRTVAMLWQKAINATGFAKIGGRWQSRREVLIAQARAIAVCCVVPPESAF